MFVRFKEKLARRATVKKTISELSMLTDKELADIGIHRSMIREVANGF